MPHTPVFHLCPINHGSKQVKCDLVYQVMIVDFKFITQRFEAKFIGKLVEKDTGVKVSKLWNQSYETFRLNIFHSYIAGFYKLKSTRKSKQCCFSDLFLDWGGWSYSRIWAVDADNYEAGTSYGDEAVMKINKKIKIVILEKGIYFALTSKV